MKTSYGRSTSFEDIRKQAEQLINEADETADAEKPELVRLLHELEIYQVELELQNNELRRATRELEAARNEYLDLYESAPVGFITVNGKGIIERYNKAAARMLSAPGESLTGRSFSSRVHPKDQGVYLSYLKQLIDSKDVDPCEPRLVRRDGTHIHVRLEATSKSDPENRTRRWRLALVDITARRRQEDALRKAHDELEDRVRERTVELERRANQLARMTSQLTLAEQRERSRLAGLLHDNLQQLLAGARLHLEIMAGEVAASEDPAYRSTHDLINESIRTARSLSAELSPPVLFQKSLAEALEWLARWMRETHRLAVDLNLDAGVPPVPEELRVLLFQSVREILFNVVKHAGTDTARMVMWHQDERVMITISDRGSGFDPAERLNVNNPASEGFGLFTIRERLISLGGAFDLVSRPEAGTTVSLVAPINPSMLASPGKKTAAPAKDRRAAIPSAPESQPGAGGKIRVLLVDDHAVMRNGLSMLLSRSPDIDVAGEAADGEEAIQLARRIRPDVILMDINMPKMNGLDATRIIHAEMPRTRIIGLSMHKAEDQAAAIMDAGAVAYISKSGSTAALLAAIKSTGERT